MTFVFVNTVLSLIYNPLENKLAGGLVAGLSLYTAMVGASSISGGVVNPALGFALQLNQYFIGQYYRYTFTDPANPNVLKSVDLRITWIYVFGPLLGGILAGLWKRYDAIVKTKMQIQDGNPYFIQAVESQLDNDTSLPPLSKQKSLMIRMENSQEQFFQDVGEATPQQEEVVDPQYFHR